MKKILGFIVGSFITECFYSAALATEKFDIIPDLPEPLAAAQASSITTTTSDAASSAVQSVSSEPNFLSVIISLIFVILIIYATGIVYAKLNKVGIKTLKKQIGDGNNSRVAVISTTPLGNNKTLHVVELDGKRMLIGASPNSIDLIKDLGTYPPQDFSDGEYSKIEIPNIRIPKIEIPKIEFPNIGFTKAFKTSASEEKPKEEVLKEEENQNENQFEISDIYEESSDGIIDKLFTQPTDSAADEKAVSQEKEVVHSVDPDEYALYKKYL